MKDAQTVSIKKALNPRILFEDPNLLVLSKPPGLLSQGDQTNEPSLVDWLRIYLGRPYVGLIHRLDRRTSGLMVVAKRTKSARRLTDSLQSGKLTRRYQAWLVGHLEGEVSWAHELVKDSKKNLTLVKKGGKNALLIAKPLKHIQGTRSPLTLVEFTLQTGRSHQIRVQSAHEGFPILGDTQYGKNNSFPRLALHSTFLSFPHPITEEILEFHEDLPVDLRFT